MHVLLRRYGNLIDVGIDSSSPTPPELINLLSPHLYYDHKRLLRGAEAYDSVSGRRDNVEITPTRLYRLENGRLTTGYGFINAIGRLLQAAGHVTHFVDLSPPRTRPECFTPDWETVDHTFNWRPRQRECLEAMARSEGGLIHAAMGFGKTFLFSGYSLLFPRARIAIVVKPRDVAYRLVRQLTRYIPNVGMVGDGKYRVDRVTVYMADSVHHCDGDVDHLLADEGHQLMTDRISERLGGIFQFSRNFVFSGSPTARMDGAHRKLECLFGDRIFYLPYQEAVQLGLVVQIHVRWIPIVMQENPAKGKSGVPRLRWGIWRNEARNQAIADDIHRSVPPDEQVLVSVATLEHAIYLWQKLPDFTLAYAQADVDTYAKYKRQGLIPDSFTVMTTARRDAMRSAFERGELKRVIATNIWSTGVDFEQLQWLYRADAIESESMSTQWPSRPSRIFEGKTQANVVDCLDLFDTSLKRKSMTRRTHYRAQGWPEEWPLVRGQLNGV